MTVALGGSFSDANHRHSTLTDIYLYLTIKHDTYSAVHLAVYCEILPVSLLNHSLHTVIFDVKSRHLILIFPSVFLVHSYFSAHPVCYPVHIDRVCPAKQQSHDSIEKLLPYIPSLVYHLLPTRNSIGLMDWNVEDLSISFELSVFLFVCSEVSLLFVSLYCSLPSSRHIHKNVTQIVSIPKTA